MLMDYLDSLRSKTSTSEFRAILAMTEQDIKFNRVFFNKVTGTKQFIVLCNRCFMALRRC